MPAVIRRGDLIGLVGGLLTGPVMLAWLFLYSAVTPNRDLGSTAALGPFIGGFESTLLGVILGGVIGAVASLMRIELSSLSRCALFGAFVMGSIGILLALGDYFGSPERFAAWGAMIVGMDVACPLVAGIAGGSLVARLTKARGVHGNRNE